MDPDNRLCSDCGLSIAEFFCACTNPETFLCEEHLSKHTRKVAMKGHQPWPITYLPRYKNPVLLIRSEGFKRVKEEALGSIGLVDRAVTELTIKVQEIQDALTTLCSEKVKELREMKAILSRDIPLALEEVERTLTEEHPLFNTQYGPLFRQHAEKGNPIQLFTFTVKTGSPQTLISVHSELPNPQDLLTPAKLAGVFNNGVFLYDVETEQFTRHTLSASFSAGGTYVKLDSNKLLGVGASPASTAVHLLELTSFQISTLPSLTVPRYSPGLAKIKARVYAFGGYDGQNMWSCEKMEISSKRWAVFGNMTHPRSGFTPCLFRSLLYLLSADVRAVETFDSETETFAVLSVSLPPQYTLGCASVGFIANGELCFLTEAKQMARWKIETENEFRVSETGNVICSNQQPLIVGSLVLIAYFGSVIHFSLETYSVLKYLT